MRESTKSLFELLRWTRTDWHQRAAAADVRGSAAHKDLADLWKGFRRYYGRHEVLRRLREEKAKAALTPHQESPNSD